MSRTRHHSKHTRKRLDNWLGNEPKWWRNMTKHRRQRAWKRKALHDVMSGDEEALFPLDKRPWEYYW